MNFETATANCFNDYFEKNNLDALAYRFPRYSRFVVQPADVMVDSLDGRYYLVIECKSIKYKGQKTLFFSSNFSDKGKEHQIDRLEKFANKTGRKPLLAVELRSRPTEAYLLPFSIVTELFSDLRPGVPIETIRTGKKLGRKHGKYILSDF